MKKILIISTILVSAIFAVTPPNPDQYFPNEVKDYTNGKFKVNETDKKDLVGTDALPSEFKKGTGYSSEFGRAKFKIKINDKGIKEFHNLETNKTMTTFNIPKPSKEYADKLKAYRDSIKKNEPISVQRAKLQEVKQASKNEVFKNGFSMKNYSSTLLKVNPVAKGRTIVNDRFLSSDQNASESERNASKFYNKNFSFLPKNADSDNIKDTNVGKLKKAYDYVKQYEQLAKSKINGGTISCYISRELVPAYYCPFPDMTETKYPDFNNPNGDPLKVTSAEAEELCNSICHKTRKCLPYKVMDDTNYDTRIPSLRIYPWVRTDNRISINTVNTMQIDTIEFDINVTKGSGYTGKDFNQYLQGLNPPPKFRLNLSLETSDPDHKIAKIYEMEDTNLRSSFIHKKLRILRTTKKLYIDFYKTFFYGDNNPLHIIKNEKLMKNIGTVTISNVKVHYTSDSLYFCPFKQIVDEEKDCPNGEILTLTSGSSVYNVCTNTDHKIGPDPINGGFYSEEGCESSCSEHKDCKTTYKHYSNIAVNQLYKAHVGCVDSDQNSGCTDELCASYFANETKRPINEIVIQKDNKRVYTIKNKLLTKEMRPKINYDKEMNSINYELNFQTEMKDRAYANMVTKKTYDRVKYLIGQESPRKQAINTVSIDGKKNLEVIIKPSSKEFDNGIRYRLYSVIEFEQTYKPSYGLFLVDRHYINATTQPIVFKDVSYMIKQANGQWKIFRVINFAKIRKTREILYCKQGDGSILSQEYHEGQYVGDNCSHKTEVYWDTIPAYIQDRNVFYNPNNDTFLNYGLGDKASYYKSLYWNSDLIENRFNITQDLYGDIQNTPGAVIHSQEEKQNGASFARRYNTDFNATQRGYVANVALYSFYASHDLTYQEVMDNINKNNLVWDLANGSSYATKINDDGEINNNIRPFIVGAPNKTTLDIDIKPKFNEEGKRVFKFMFLYDKNEDPFKDN